jgi:hypothetical protein
VLPPTKAATLAALISAVTASARQDINNMWPDEQVKVFPHALCASVMRQTAKDAEALSHCDNFWLSKVSSNSKA